MGLAPFRKWDNFGDVLGSLCAAAGTALEVVAAEVVTRDEGRSAGESRGEPVHLGSRSSRRPSKLDRALHPSYNITVAPSPPRDLNIPPFRLFVSLSAISLPPRPPLSRPEFSETSLSLQNSRDSGDRKLKRVRYM